MNTLTPNRILQKGDEYRDNGTWKAVPKDDFGLQIMFTKYAEVRRPSEKHFSAPVPDKSLRTPQKSAPATAAPSDEKREGTPSPVPDSKLHSRGGENPLPTAPLAQSEQEIEASGLPTVVSSKAHRKHLETLYGKPIGFDHKGKLVRETKPNPTPDPVPCKTCGSILCSGDPCVDPTYAILPPAPVGLSKPPKTETEKAAAEAKTIAARKTSASIDYPHGAPACIWTGRNGTFTARGLNIHHTKGGQIMLIPVGKRGTAKNALIEFPACVAKQVIASLESMLTNP